MTKNEEEIELWMILEGCDYMHNLVDGFVSIPRSFLTE
jgi:hypothetical protein